MPVFIEDRELEHIEKQGSFMQAVEYTFSRWAENKENIQFLLRAGTEAWFADVFDCFSNEAIDYDRCDMVLTETYRYGEAHFGNQAHFLCVFGYMLRLFPFYFNIWDHDFEKWKQRGMDMIERAHQLEPSDRFIQAVYSLDSGKRVFLSEDYFCGNSEVETYFGNILCESRTE